MFGGKRRRAALWLLAGLLLLASRPILDGRPSRYVHIRWSSAVTADERAGLEREFSLRMQQGEDRSYGYDLLNDSSSNIRALLRHPAVEDSDGFDRDRFVVRDDAELGDARTGLAWRFGVEAVVAYVLPLATLIIFVAGSLLAQDLLGSHLFRAAAGPGVTRERIVEVDALRGLAALAVVLFHYTSEFNEGYPHPNRPLLMLPLGHYGVELFFVISGMVILMTLERSRSALDFLVARVGRLYPAYWVAMTATFVALAWIGLPNNPVTPEQYAWNLTMLQRFVGAADVDGVYWSLQVELAFYLLMLAIFALRLLPAIEAVLLGWLVVLALDYRVALLDAMTADPGLLRQIVTLFGHAELFIIGMAMHFWRSRGLSAGAVVSIAGAVLLRATHVPREATYVTLVIVALFLLVVTRRAGWLAARPLLFVGAVSYPLYLIHQNIGYMLLRGLYARGFESNTAILVVLAVVLAVAAAIHYAVELPGQKLAKRLRYTVPVKPVTAAMTVMLLVLSWAAAAGAQESTAARVDTATRILRTPRTGEQPLAEQHAAALRSLDFDVLAVGADLLHNDRIGTEAARAMLVVDEPRAMSLILSTIPQAPPSVQLVGFLWFLEHELTLGDRLDGDARAAALRVLDRIPSSAMAELALYTIGMSGSEADFPLLERFAAGTGFGTQGMRAASEAALTRLGSVAQTARLRAALAAPVPDRLTFQDGIRVVTALRQAAFSANVALVPLVCPHLADPELVNIDIRLEPGRVAANTLSALLEPITATLPRAASRRSAAEWQAYCAAL